MTNSKVGILTISALCLVGWVAPAGAQTIKQLQAEVTALQTQVNRLQTTVNTQQTTINSLQTVLTTVQANKALLLGPYVTVDANAENGLKGPNVVFSGANVHIVSGSGRTIDDTGWGNLVVGYNGESSDISLCSSPSQIEANRTGSHNFIMGDCHQFTSSGGLLAGLNNIVSEPFASVSGGQFNIASGVSSSVSGGHRNEASGDGSSVSGGAFNTASGDGSSVSGGVSNEASGNESSVGGGANQNATGAEQNIN